MRKAFRHTGVLMLIAVVALGLIGAAYTLWYEELNLNARVTTGTFDVDWSFENEGARVCLNGHRGPEACDTLDEFISAPTTDPRTASKFPVCDGKIINDSSPDAADRANDAPAGATANTLNLRLGNLYPYAGCKFAIDIHNSGTVPAHFALEFYDYSGDLAPGSLAVSSVVRSKSDMVPDAQAQALCRALGAYFQKALPNYPGDGPLPDLDLQLHANEQVTCNVLVYLKQDGGAEGKSVNITWELVGHQWNETVVQGANGNHGH